MLIQKMTIKMVFQSKCARWLKCSRAARRCSRVIWWRHERWSHRSQIASACRQPNTMDWLFQQCCCWPCSWRWRSSLDYCIGECVDAAIAWTCRNEPTFNFLHTANTGKSSWRMADSTTHRPTRSTRWTAAWDIATWRSRTLARRVAPPPSRTTTTNSMKLIDHRRPSHFSARDCRRHSRREIYLEFVKFLW